MLALLSLLRLPSSQILMVIKSRRLYLDVVFNQFTNPGWILLSNESDFSASQKKDGHVGHQ